MSNKAVHLETGQMQCADKALFGHPLYDMQHTHETDTIQACAVVVAIGAAATCLCCLNFAILAALMLAV